MNTNKHRLSLVARELRLMAMAAENASEPQEYAALIQSLQTAITLLSLCLFNRQTRMIQAVAHDLDIHEMGDVR